MTFNLEESAVSMRETILNTSTSEVSETETVLLLNKTWLRGGMDNKVV